jgi:hypothetical protein
VRGGAKDMAVAFRTLAVTCDYLKREEPRAGGGSRLLSLDLFEPGRWRRRPFTYASTGQSRHFPPRMPRRGPQRTGGASDGGVSGAGLRAGGAAGRGGGAEILAMSLAICCWPAATAACRLAMSPAICWRLAAS